MKANNKEDVLTAIDHLIDDLVQNPDSWENPTLERYLEAIHAWLKTADGPPSWDLLKQIFEVGKIYE